MTARSIFLRFAIPALSMTAGWSGTSTAQEYPVKPVRVITAFSAGTAGDQLSRLVARQLSDSSGQQFVMDNRAGASGLIGTMAVAQAPADGYTLLFCNDSLVINPGLQRKPPYDPIKNFAPITVAANIPYAFIVHPSLPVTSIKTLVALAKARPGEINYATGGIPQRLAMEMFAGAMGIKLANVDYKGTGPAFSDVLGGQIPMMFAGVTNALPHVAGGRLRVLAVSSARRSSALPAVPTMAEAGVPGYNYAVWLGYLAPVGTPEAVVAKLHTDIARILDAVEMRQTFDKLGIQGVGNSPADFGRLLREDLIRLPALIKRAGIPGQ